MISGIIGLVAMFSTRNLPGFLWMLLTALLHRRGVLLIWKPVEGALSLTLLLARASASDSRCCDTSTRPLRMSSGRT